MWQNDRTPLWSHCNHSPGDFIIPRANVCLVFLSQEWAPREKGNVKVQHYTCIQNSSCVLEMLIVPHCWWLSAPNASKPQIKMQPASGCCSQSSVIFFKGRSGRCDHNMCRITCHTQSPPFCLHSASTSMFHIGPGGTEPEDSEHTATNIWTAVDLALCVSGASVSYKYEPL